MDDPQHHIKQSTERAGQSQQAKHLPSPARVGIESGKDVARVSAQLQATALQFSTVDSVSIYVNGALLEDVLN